jgi:hypothetical protein
MTEVFAVNAGGCPDSAKKCTSHYFCALETRHCGDLFKSFRAGFQFSTRDFDSELFHEMRRHSAGKRIKVKVMFSI